MKKRPRSEVNVSILDGVQAAVRGSHVRTELREFARRTNMQKMLAEKLSLDL